MRISVKNTNLAIVPVALNLITDKPLLSIHRTFPLSHAVSLTTRDCKKNHMP